MKRHWSIGFMLVLIYLFPALMDLVVSVIAFVNPIRVAKMGHGALAVAAVGAIWGFTYMVACPLVGHRLTPANAGRVVLASCICTVVVCALFTVFSGLAGIYILAACAAIGAALFFPGFQVFMKAADGAHHKPVTYSTGLYTFAWSSGYALAPFVSGFLMELGAESATREPIGWKYCYVFAGLCALAAAIGFVLVERFNKAQRPPGDAEPPPPSRQDEEPADDNAPDLAWLGWIAAGAGVFALALIRNVFPSRAVASLHMADSTQGLIAFLLYLVQALTGLALISRRGWMYSPRATGAFGAIGLAGSLFFAFSAAPLWLACGAILFGMYSGFFFFYFVFHALCHPVKAARYVGINEAVVGISGLVGPVIGGVIADRAGYSPAFLSGSVVVALATAFQVAVHRRYRRAAR